MTDTLREDFWEAITDDRTVMLGVTGPAHVELRPMTVQRRDDDTRDDALYFFASRDEGVGADVLRGTNRALLAFASKDHEIFASATGQLTQVSDQAIIDELWTPFAALYYKDGKQDPNLILLRLDHAQIDVWRQSTTGFLKSIAYKIMGRDAGDADPNARTTITT